MYQKYTTYRKWLTAWTKSVKTSRVVIPIPVMMNFFNLNGRFQKVLKHPHLDSSSDVLEIFSVSTLKKHKSKYK